MSIFYGVVVFIFGLIFGSFLNCVAMRMVRGQDWVHGSSHCIKCGHELTAKDLFPLFSYLSTGGRCRYCREKISARYPLTELTFAILIVILYGYFVAPVISSVMGLEEVDKRQALILITEFLRDAFFTGCLFVIALVDLEKFEIPDGCLLFGIVIWIVTVPILIDKPGIENAGIWILKHVGAALIVCVVMLLIAYMMDRILGQESLGGGDIKLFSVLALYLGLAGTYELVIISCFIGLLFAALWRFVLGKGSKAFPFGPSIAISGYILLILETHITKWYMSLI